jgi:hypothetical protein
MALDRSLRTGLRIKAASTALEFLQAKPATRQQREMHGRDCHLDWLYQLATNRTGDVTQPATKT